MSLVSKGTPIAVATDIDYHEDVDSLVRTETIVQHIEETASDLTVSGSLKAEIGDIAQLYSGELIVATIECQDVAAEDVAANVLLASSLSVLEHSELNTVTATGLVEAQRLKAETLNLTIGAMALEGTDYVVSNKWLPTDAANPGANEEQKQSDNTIVTRTRADGVRIDNLQIRGRAADYNEPFPGLFFTDGTCSDDLSFVHDGNINFKRTAGETSDALRYYAQPTDAQPIWRLRANGHFEYAGVHADAAHADAGQNGHNSKSDFMVDDNSLYVGSSRFSYSRSAHEVTLHKLKTTQLPKYFTDLGYSSSNLPTGYTTATMTIQRYMALARELASDNDLDVRDVLPASTTTDWDVCVISGLASDADVAAKQDQLSTAQLAVVDKTFAAVSGNSASTICTADAIKTYVDAQNHAGGSSGSTRFDVTHSNTWYQLADDITEIVWGNHHNGVSNGGNGRYQMPTLSGFSGDSFHFSLHVINPINGTGEPQMKVMGSHTWNNSADDHADHEFSGSDVLLLKNAGRNSYRFSFRASTSKWYVHQMGLETGLVTQITTNKTYFKHFENDEAGYQTGTVFLLPSGYHTYIVNYGDGTNFGSGSGGDGDALGVNVALPAEPVDGTKVLLHSSDHRQTSSSIDCITLNFPGGVSGYGTRRISAAGTATAASVGINIVCPASNNHSKNHTYIYSSASDVWVQLVDMN